MENPEAPAALPAPGGREDPAALLKDWTRYATRAVDGVETFTKQKPLAAVLFAFVAGLILNALISALLRRRS